MGKMETAIYKAAINKWGNDHQITVAIEEMSELTKELCKYKRGNQNITNMVKEIADVEIMVEQLKIIFDVYESVKEEKEFKLERLRKRIEE